MRPQATSSLAAWPADLTPPRGVLVLSGYGLSVRVWRGRLRVADGVGRDRREALVHRATGRLPRLFVLGHTGAVSLEAVRWLADVGAGYLQLDADGRVLAAFGPQGTDRPGLRRAQARALDTPLGVDIARRLIAEKVAGQAEVLARADGAEVDDATLATLRDAMARLHVAVTRDDVRWAEAAAAGAYWSALSAVSVRFARREAERVPAHWRALGGRTSPLTGGPRLAGNPANAILNYLYAILEGEASLAARVVGLDPGLGVLHADQLNRDSLSADLMEPVRPLVDCYVLELLARRPFAADEFYETRQGVCRVTPPLARELALTAPDWGLAAGRVAEDVARLLEPTGGNGRPAPTPVSGRNRSAGRGPVARRVSVAAVRPAGRALWVMRRSGAGRPADVRGGVRPGGTSGAGPHGLLRLRAGPARGAAGGGGRAARGGGQDADRGAAAGAPARGERLERGTPGARGPRDVQAGGAACDPECPGPGAGAADGAVGGVPRAGAEGGGGAAPEVVGTSADLANAEDIQRSHRRLVPLQACNLIQARGLQRHECGRLQPIRWVVGRAAEHGDLWARCELLAEGAHDGHDVRIDLPWRPIEVLARLELRTDDDILGDDVQREVLGDTKADVRLIERERQRERRARNGDSLTAYVCRAVVRLACVAEPP